MLIIFTSISLSDQIQIAATIVTATGIIVALFANRNQLKIFNKQLKLNFFADYTKRYQEIILNLPENIGDDDFSLDNLDEKAKSKTQRYMRAYFDLCSEEYHLNQQSHIDDNVWETWEMGIKHALSKKAFKHTWNQISKNTRYKSDFKHWMDNLAKSR